MGGDEPGDASAAPLPISPRAVKPLSRIPSRAVAIDTPIKDAYLLLPHGGTDDITFSPTLRRSSFTVVCVHAAPLLLHGGVRPQMATIKTNPSCTRFQLPGFCVGPRNPSHDLDLKRRSAPLLVSSHMGSIIEDDCRVSALPPRRLFLPLKIQFVSLS